MKYTPRPLDPEASDVSRGHDRGPLGELALLTVGLVAIIAVLYLIGVLVTDFVVGRISPAREGRLFSIVGNTLPQAKSLDPALELRKQTAERVLQKLLPNAGLKGLPIQLIVWDSPVINAVALPGGTLAVTPGLLASLDGEEAIGFVLAHELGHFHGRDHLRGLGRRLGFQVLMSLLFSSGDIRIGADQAGELVLLSYSRKREAAADQYALQLLHRTLGSVSGATRLFEVLARKKTPAWAYMFNTHPDTQGRIEKLRAQASLLGQGPHENAGLVSRETVGSQRKAAEESSGALDVMAPVLHGSQSYLGAVTRGPLGKKHIALTFTAHQYAEGAATILDALGRHRGKGSFFLTGDFLANTNFDALVRRFLLEGHYVGPHSDKHLLYCGWEKSRPTLVTHEEFRADLEANVSKVVRHQRMAARAVAGQSLQPPAIFLPPYEHYNQQIADWTRGMRMALINYTPGTRSNADYTGEAEKNFVSSEVIYRSILDYETKDPNGLNGFILLLHLGAGPGRKDKFHERFPDLLQVLSERGYIFVTVEKLLESR